MSDMRSMMEQLAENHKNPDRYLMVGNQGIRWTEKGRIQNLINLCMSRIAELEEKTEPVKEKESE